MEDLFDAGGDMAGERLPLAPGAWLLRGFARVEAPAVLDAITAIAKRAPFRHMRTRGGFTMSVAMTNCGEAGWVTDRRGYRYQNTDPESDRAWPPMPPVVLALAQRAAEAAGYPGFEPDACLVNRYLPGSRLSLHQDRNERDFTAPIVSVSLGVPARFLFGGVSRQESPRPVALRHGDVVVWGGPARLAYHGVAPLERARHPLTGEVRYNLTVRRAQ